MRGIVIPQQGPEVLEHQSGANARRRGNSGVRSESEGKHRGGEKERKETQRVNTEEEEAQS